ncbi:Trypsin-like peptidase domain-containing protein [Paenibacillus sp. UNC496MF]|uniref:S1C family serine protease n=1 Tax=Paenibacillus sp. UNC496MF TaxID=1502753 RepID=UPI0008EFB04C|nr:trypsin-like peptidase domain-containing protein [Paenibacillus sp. UNC496MF]SFI39589.1 Trypsin-like peptidase domain-containing protein [Paenibacillus sp. UNC496MF]
MNEDTRIETSIKLNADENKRARKSRKAAKTGSANWRAMFATFMAGAAVIGGLTFASDKMNLFGYAARPAQAAVSSAGDSAAAGVQSASLASSGTNGISSIVKAASPAIVKIETKVDRAANGQARRSALRQGAEGGDAVESGIGSGFVFDSSGYIMTNEHVIDGADEIEVYVQGVDAPFTATLLGSRYDLDLAVLKINGDKAFPALKIGDSDATAVGDWVVAIGNPYDFDYSVTTGVLSAKEREISIDDEQGTRNYKHLLQTDTAINPGNSGGPLLNTKGEVIGINTAVNAEAQGIGFAIPASTVNSVIDQLKASGTGANGRATL